MLTRFFYLDSVGLINSPNLTNRGITASLNSKNKHDGELQRVIFKNAFEAQTNKTDTMTKETETQVVDLTPEVQSLKKDLQERDNEIVKLTAELGETRKNSFNAEVSTYLSSKVTEGIIAPAEVEKLKNSITNAETFDVLKTSIEGRNPAIVTDESEAIAKKPDLELDKLEKNTAKSSDTYKAYLAMNSKAIDRDKIMTFEQFAAVENELKENVINK